MSSFLSFNIFSVYGIPKSVRFKLSKNQIYSKGRDVFQVMTVSTFSDTLSVLCKAWAQPLSLAPVVVFYKLISKRIYTSTLQCQTLFPSALHHLQDTTVAMVHENRIAAGPCTTFSFAFHQEPQVIWSLSKMVARDGSRGNTELKTPYLVLSGGNGPSKCHNTDFTYLFLFLLLN